MCDINSWAGGAATTLLFLGTECDGDAVPLPDNGEGGRYWMVWQVWGTNHWLMEARRGGAGGGSHGERVRGNRSRSNKIISNK